MQAVLYQQLPLQGCCCSRRISSFCPCCVPSLPCHQIASLKYWACVQGQTPLDMTTYHSSAGKAIIRYEGSQCARHQGIQLVSLQHDQSCSQAQSGMALCTDLSLRRAMSALCFALFSLGTVAALPNCCSRGYHNIFHNQHVHNITSQTQGFWTLTCLDLRNLLR